MMPSSRLFFTLSGLFLAAQLFAQTTTPNNTLRGRVLYQSSGNKPAKGVRIKETDSNGDYSKDNGDYRLVFQTKRNGAALALEVGPDTRDGKKIELVNEKELKSAKLPAGDKELLDIIVCPAGQRDIAAQKYYRILRTTADRELERKKKEVEDLLAQKEKDYQKISDLFAQLDGMQAALDSAKIREQAFNIASINLDRASQMVKDAVRKIDEENDVEGALKILSAEALDTAYQNASALKKKAEVAIRQVIEGYEFKISLLDPQFKYGEVAECYEKIAEICEKEDYDKKELVTALGEASYYWGLHGDYQKGLQFNLQALAICEKFLPADHSNLARLNNGLGEAYEHLGDYQNALKFNEKALAILGKASPPDDAHLAVSYHYLATAYGNVGDYQKQLEFNEKALAIREKILPAGHSDLGDSYDFMARTYTNLGDYQKALEFNLKFLTISEKTLPADHPDLGVTYVQLATTYLYLGDYQKTLEYSLKALVILEKVLSGNHLNLAAVYTNLAFAYGNLGDYQKQLEFMLKTLAIEEKALPADHPNLATSYNNLAQTYIDLGDYQKSLEYNMKALAIREKSLPADHSDLAISYNLLAGIYYNLGDYQKALEYNLKALFIREKNLPADHPDLGVTYNNLAFTYGSLGDYHKQLEFTLKALAIREKILPADHPDLAVSYSNTGRVYRDVGEYEKAIEYGQKAIQTGEASTPKHPGLNRFCANLGITYVKARQYPEAKTALEKSESLKPEERVYRGWAMYYALQKKKKLALEYLQKAVTLGFKDLKWLETEPDLKNIRKEKGYRDLVEQLKKQ